MGTPRDRARMATWLLGLPRRNTNPPSCQSVAKKVEGVILAADDMPPSTFLATDWQDGGLVLRRGSPSSHVAILARSRGVPMIVGVDVDHLEDGADALLDADAGLLVVDPDANMRASFDQRRAEQSKAREIAHEFTGPA